MRKRCLKLNTPQHGQSSENKKRLSIYRDYIDRLEKLFPEISVTSWDPGISFEWWEKYNSGTDPITHDMVIKERLGGDERMSLYMVHLILKSHNLHNRSIESYE
jgi:hypothetical protein